MKKLWVQGLEDDEANIMRGDFLSSRPIRMRLKEVLENKMRQKYTALHSKTNYGDPNWTHSHSDNLGYLRALAEVISYIEDGDAKVNVLPSKKGENKDLNIMREFD